MRSHAADLIAELLRIDILVAPPRPPGLLTGNMVKGGAVVIDVGINRVEGRLVGDVDFDFVAPVASAITPSPAAWVS